MNHHDSDHGRGYVYDLVHSKVPLLSAKGLATRLLADIIRHDHAGVLLDVEFSIEKAPLGEKVVVFSMASLMSDVPPSKV